MSEHTRSRAMTIATLVFGVLVAGGCDSTVLRADGEGGAGATGNGGAMDGGAASVGPGGPGSTSNGSSSTGSTSSGSGSTTSGSTTSGSTTSGSTTSGSGSTGNTTSAVSTGSVQCSPMSDACTQCASTQCAEDWCSCSANTECTSLIECWYGCQTQDCYQSCMTAHPTGTSAALLVFGCADCTNSCGGQPTDPCSECLYTTCDDELNACVAEPDCLNLWTCLGDCAPGGLSCQAACYDAYPSGVGLLETLFNCAGTSCPTCN
ncbi:MAG: hypothetical protein U0271_23090 [Polyangiaceae bacterium]